ncbi:MAG TPA: hypothetical protein VF267_10570 [Gammaproteobacteria bacterium]
MQVGTPLCGAAEREFLATGDPGGTGKVRRLPVVTALPDPPTPMGESTRVESLIFDDPPT